MTVTCVLLDTTDSTKNLTLGSVDGTKVTVLANGTGSPPTRSVNGADFDKGVQNVNNVGLTVSAFLAMTATVKEPVTPTNNLTVASHASDSSLVIVTIASDSRTLKAGEVRDAIANCLRNT